MDENMKKQGMFSWNELMTNDVSAAKQFYSSLLGWEYEEINSPDMVYHIARLGDKQVGGIMANPVDAKDAPPMWGSYVTVDNVDSSAKKSESLGGKVLIPPTDIPDIGRFTVIQDNQGAMLTLITYTGNCQ